MKSVFLYQVTMGHGQKDEETVYCYARNAGVAIDSLKEKYKDKKFDAFKAKMFGEADIEMHPEPFKIMTNEEVAIVEKNGLASKEKYSQRKNTVPEGEFISADKLDEFLAKGDSV